MSAAATAAGYLYASGRLRGRGAREQEEHKNEQPRTPQKAQEQEPREPRERIRVAVLEEKPRRAPKIEYRTRKRWTAGA
jgi:hypothetical protein